MSNFGKSNPSGLDTKKESAELRRKNLPQIRNMFPLVPDSVIIHICNRCKWDVQKCVDEILKYVNSNESINADQLKTRDIKNKYLYSNTGMIPALRNNETKEIVPIMQLSSRRLETNIPNPFNLIYQTDLTNPFQDIVSLHRQNYKVLVLMRGVPGSGKSTLCNDLIMACYGNTLNAKDMIFSTDDYFYDARKKTYTFKREYLPEAHAANQRYVGNHCRDGWSPVIVDNTNVRAWEMDAYVEIAIRHSYLIRILEANTSWAKSVGQCFKRNTHNVPKDQIERMLNSYENVTVQQLIKVSKLNYDTSIMPQKRRLPVLQSDLQDVIKPSTSTEAESDINKFAKFVEESTKITEKNNSPEQSLLVKETEVELKEIERHTVGCLNENQSFVYLRSVFPNIPTTELWDIFENCNGELEWVVDLLSSDQDLICHNTCSDDKQIDNFICSCQAKTDHEIKVEIDPTISSEILSAWDDSITVQPKNERNTSKRRQMSRKVRENPVAVELKKHLEESFIIGADHYSNATRKVRNSKRGIRDPAPVIETMKPNDGKNTNSNSTTDNDSAEELKNCEECDQDYLEVDLGQHLIAQLKETFGDIFSINEDARLSNTVLMPTKIAKKIYFLWIESVTHQLEEKRFEYLKEDEEFAKRIAAAQITENLNLQHKSLGTSLNDLCDMEAAWSEYQSTVNEQGMPYSTGVNYKKKYSTVVKLQQLEIIFPSMDSDCLSDVLAAHNNDLDQTIMTLKEQLTTNYHDDDERKREIESLIERAAEEASKSPPIEEEIAEVDETALLDISNNDIDDMSDEEQLNMKFKKYRKKTSDHIQYKFDCLAKSRASLRYNNYQQAKYYSHLANCHTKCIIENQRKAAIATILIHKSKGNVDSIDLHYLHLAEAMHCLNIFVDYHIAKLANTHAKYKELHVITGRGLHSHNNIPVIKNGAKEYLRRRSIHVSEFNPGVLKFRIYRKHQYKKMDATKFTRANLSH